MADPINTLPGDRNPDGFNPATRANATLNTDNSRIGDGIDGGLDRELEAEDTLGYNNPAQSGGVTRAANADVYADTATNTTTHIAATSNDIAHDPTVYDVRVVSPRGSVVSPVSGTVPPGVSESDFSSTQERVTTGVYTSTGTTGSTGGIVATGTGSDDTPETVEEARAQVEATRDHLASTIEEIKERLSPSHIAEQAKDAAKAAVNEKVDEAKHAVTDKVTDVKTVVTDKVHEVVTGASMVASAAVAQVNEIRHTAAEKARGLLGGAKDSASSAPSALGNKAGNVAALAADRAKSLAITASAQAEQVAQGAKGAGSSVVETIRLNPLPAALIGIGVGWLLLSIKEQNSVGARYQSRLNERDLYPDEAYGDVDDAFSTRSYGTYAGYSGAGATTAGFTATGGAATERVKSALGEAGDKASGAASEAKAKVGEAVGTAREKASDLTEAARDKASDLAQTASQLAATTRDKAGDLASGAKERVSGAAVEVKAKSQEAVGSVDTFIHENPLAAGAIALGLGVVVGLLLPTTRKESEILGPTRDRLVDQAKETASDMAQKAQKVAEAALGTAKESLTEVQEALTHSLDDAKNAVKQGVEDAKVAVKETVQTEAQSQGLTGQSQNA